MSSVFKFKQFEVLQEKSALKVGTDSMLLGALISPSEAERGLDLGTGTGVLALMIAQKFGQISIDAIEKDNDSYMECCFNFKSSPWSNRLSAHLGNYYDFAHVGVYDLIFSNPPFYVEIERNTKSFNVQSKHTSQNELTQLISLVSKRLSTQGVFWVIVPYNIYEYIIDISIYKELYVNNIIIINSKKNKLKTRVVLSFSFSETSPIQREFTIRNLDNSYTKEYIKLTEKFHFKKLDN